MDAIETVRMGWRNLTDHKLRATLTVLGVVIGVAAVITFVTLGASLQADIVQTIAGENTRVMYVSTTSDSDSRLPPFGRGGQAVFTSVDVNNIRSLRGVEAVAPQGGIATERISHGNQTVARQWVTVTTPSYFRMRGFDVVAGRPFRVGEQEVVVNEDGTRLFAPNLTVGDKIVMRPAATGESRNATVVGIVNQSDSATSPLVGNGPAPAIYAPPDPYYERRVSSPTTGTPKRVYAQVLVSARTVEGVGQVRGRVLTYLAERSDARILTPAGAEFEVTTHEQLVDQIEQVSDTFTAYVTSIAVISLVVGAIGIANIMLVSVTERTREIGIMKALGARDRDVLQLFLTEAVMLGVAGAGIGGVVGVGSAWLLTRLLELPLQLRPVWFGMAVLVGILVGVTSGLYPAWDAARTDTIEALRYE